MNIADLRKSYEKAELSEDASASDPLKQFERWLNEAIQSEVPEPNAMTVATVASNLRPSTRVVLIKGYDERGIVWYTNYDSRKGQVIDGRTVLVTNAAKYAAQFMLNPPRPPHWGGYRLVPDEWQFWQGRRSRLHDRLRYRINEGDWLRERLAP